MNDELSPAAGELIPPRRDYPLLTSRETVAKVLGRIDEILGLNQSPNAQLDPFKLSRIKNAVGSGGSFEVDTATGAENLKTFIGVIVAFRAARSYYKKAFGAGQSKNQPPDCSSKDGFIGEGIPGGDCSRCPLNDWGTAAQGTGMACRELRQLLVLLPGQMVPHLMQVTPTSLDNFKKYSLTLLSGDINYWEIATRMTLDPSTTASGMPIQRIRFALYSKLAPEQAAMLAPYHERMMELLTAMTVDVTPYEISETTGTPGEAGRSGTNPTDDDVPF